MRYKALIKNIVFRLLIFSGITAGLSLTIFTKQWLFTWPFLVLWGISFFNFIYYIQGVNRKLAYFFESVRHEDGALQFPVQIKDPSLSAFHQGLNQINQTLNTIKKKNAYRERFFQEFLKQSDTGFLAVDDKGFVEIINDKALHFFGLLHLSHTNRLRQSDPTLFQVLQTVKPNESLPLKRVSKGEVLKLSIKVADIAFEEKKYKLYSIYDIKNELEDQELKSWQKLIRVLTHEIMNSIAPITSLSSTLKRFYWRKDAPIPAEELTQKVVQDTIKGLRVIEERGEGLTHFVENYRKLTRLPKPDIQSFELGEWLGAVEWLLKEQIEKEQIHWQLEHPREKVQLLGDEKLLTQVLINLVKNAIEAVRDQQDKHITVRLADANEGKIKIAVIDNGPGFEEEELENLFIPFYTTKENGSGIGLSLSRQIMHMHHGSLSARRIKEGKTIFEMHL